jgi:hypothetical protein
VTHYTLEIGYSLRPVVRVIPTDDKEKEIRRTWLQFAPHLRVSVEDAISDLVSARQDCLSGISSDAESLAQI